MSLELNMHSSPFHPPAFPNPYGSILFIIPLLLKRYLFNFAPHLSLNEILALFWDFAIWDHSTHSLLLLDFFLLNILFLKLIHDVPCSFKSIPFTAVKHFTPQ